MQNWVTRTIEMRAVRNATFADLKTISECHRKAFPRALSSAMGTRYLCKMLEWYLVDDRAFLFLVEENGVCCGYCGGLKFDGSSSFGSASSMIQHSFGAAVRTFVLRPWLLFHSEFLSKYRLVGRNLFKRVSRILGIRPTDFPKRNQSLPEPHAGLIVIGVHPDFQGKGYGSVLLTEFEIRAAAFGFERLHLTVKRDNYRAIKAYERNGWVITSSNHKSTSMQKRLKRH